MADLARLGFAVDTKDLTTAEQKLRKLSPAAKKVEDDAKKLTATFTGLGSAATKAASGSAIFMQQQSRATSGTNQFSKSVLNSSTALSNMNVNMSRVSNGFNAFNARAQQSVKTLNMVSTATQHAGLSAGQMQSNFSNMAAQFQDIGVTAAAGMSPMLIGLQQGAQLALVMQQEIGGKGLAGGLKALGGSFLSVLGPVTLLTIGFVALLAALIQFVDWTKLAQNVLNFLADNLETIALVAAAAAVTLALMYAPQIIAGIATLAVMIGTTLVNAIRTATVAMITFSLANPWAAFVLGMAVVLTAVYYFADEINKKFNVDIIGSVKNALNFIIGGFVGAVRTISKVWRDIPAVVGDAVAMAANRAIAGIEAMVNRAIDALNFLNQKANLFAVLTGGMVTGNLSHVSIGRFSSSGAGQRVAGVAAGEIGAAQNTDWVGNGIKAIKDFADDASGYLRDLAGSLGADAGKKDGKKDSDGKGGAAKFRVDASDKIGINKGAKAFREMFNAISEMWKKSEEAFKSLRDGMLENIDTMRIEMQIIGKSAEETAKLQMAQKLLNDEKYRGIIYSDDQKRQLIELAGAEAILTEELKKQKEQFDFTKATFKGFFEDIRDSLEEGKSIWSAFANAVGNALQKILDRLFDMWLDQAFQALIGNSSGGTGGILGSIFSAVGGLFGGKPKMNAKGNAFGSDIINQPTMFGYGNGKTGILGESGEEAIMPLRRGPDGSLGVQMYAANQNYGSREVHLIVSAEEGDMFVPKVRSIANDSAVKVTQTGIEEYNKSLPDRMQEISNDPRVR